MGTVEGNYPERKAAAFGHDPETTLVRGIMVKKAYYCFENQSLDEVLETCASIISNICLLRRKYARHRYGGALERSMLEAKVRITDREVYADDFVILCRRGGGGRERMEAIMAKKTRVCGWCPRNLLSSLGYALWGMSFEPDGRS